MLLMLRKGHINQQVIKQRNERYSLRTHPRKKIVTDMTIQCLGVQNTHKWEHDQTVQPPQWKRNNTQSQMIATKTSNVTTESLKNISNESAVASSDVVTYNELNPTLTSYKEGDYVLRARPPGKVSREGLAGKYSSWWKGPFMIVKIFQSEYCGNKKHYTLLNLVNNHEYKADVMHLKPFYYDPDEVIPLSVALRDTTEHYVEAILDHDINETTKVSMWKVQWDDESEAHATWEPHSTVKDVEKFHLYCYAHHLEQYLPLYLFSNTTVPFKQR